MFAILAFICFLLEQFDAKVGSIEWIALGLMFIALQLVIAFPIVPTFISSRRGDRVQQ